MYRFNASRLLCAEELFSDIPQEVVLLAGIPAFLDGMRSTAGNLAVLVD